MLSLRPIYYNICGRLIIIKRNDGPIVKRYHGSMAWIKSGFDSPWVHHFALEYKGFAVRGTQRAVSSVVERLICNEEATGSIPVRSTK